MNTNTANTRYILLYDEHCPLCDWYTRQFVRLGYLQPEGRQTLHAWERQEEASLYPDPARALHEIPLLDLQEGKVVYGIDALLRLLGQRMPWIEKLGQLPLLHGGLRLFYAFISYNRRMMAGAHPCEGACTPDFHAGWRYAWLAVAALFCTLVTVLAGKAAGEAWLGEAVGPLPALLITGSGWALFLLLTLGLPYRLRMDYLGQLATVGFVGVLLLLPGFLIQAVLPFAAPWAWAAVVACSYSFMYRMVRQRTQAVLLPAWYGHSWAMLLFVMAPLSAWFLLF